MGVVLEVLLWVEEEDPVDDVLLYVEKEERWIMLLEKGGAVVEGWIVPAPRAGGRIHPLLPPWMVPPHN